MTYNNFCFCIILFILLWKLNCNKISKIWDSNADSTILIAFPFTTIFNIAFFHYIFKYVMVHVQPSSHCWALCFCLYQSHPVKSATLPLYVVKIAVINYLFSLVTISEVGLVFICIFIRFILTLSVSITLIMSGKSKLLVNSDTQRWPSRVGCW